MKVALVIFNFVNAKGGVERYCVRFARMLKRDNHEVHVFSAHREDFPQDGFAFHDVPVRKGWSPLTIKSFADNSARMLSGEKFDIIHGFSRTYCQDIYRIGGGSHRTYLAQARPWTKTALGRLWLNLNPRHRMIFKLEELRYRRENYRRLVAISRVARDEVVRDFGVPPEDIVVVHNAVDADRFSEEKLSPLRESARREAGVGSDEILFLFLGTGWQRKGLDRLLQAFALMKERAAAKLLVAGEGPVNRYAALCERYGIAERVVFSGPGKPEKFFAAADAFIFPSLHDAFGTVALEAMAAGLPVMCSAMAGASEVIEDDKDGVVVSNPTETDELIAALGKLLDGDTRARIGRAARETAKRYSFEENYRRNMEVYKDVFEMKQSNGGTPVR
jgi:UDP-glucose:(heptosyl)LPS alpha-1,3-glucosyltransferase